MQPFLTLAEGLALKKAIVEAIDASSSGSVMIYSGPTIEVIFGVIDDATLEAEEVDNAKAKP